MIPNEGYNIGRSWSVFVNIVKVLNNDLAIILVKKKSQKDKLSDYFLFFCRINRQYISS